MSYTSLPSCTNLVFHSNINLGKNTSSTNNIDRASTLLIAMRALDQAYEEYIALHSTLERRQCCMTRHCVSTDAANQVEAKADRLLRVRKAEAVSEVSSQSSF